MPGWFGAPVLILQVTGRRTGKLCTTPLIYATVDGTPVVNAANGASARPPAWWLNLRDAGTATIWMRGHRRHVRPRLLTGPEADRARAALIAVCPAIAHYPALAGRELPLIALEHQLVVIDHDQFPTATASTAKSSFPDGRLTS